jgi:hypothetical protein
MDFLSNKIWVRIFWGHPVSHIMLKSLPCRCILFISFPALCWQGRGKDVTPLWEHSTQGVHFHKKTAAADGKVKDGEKLLLFYFILFLTCVLAMCGVAVSRSLGCMLKLKKMQHYTNVYKKFHIAINILLLCFQLSQVRDIQELTSEVNKVWLVCLISKAVWHAVSLLFDLC